MKLSDSQEALVDRYFEIRNDYDKMRGLKRAITLCRTIRCFSISTFKCIMCSICHND